MAYQRVERTCRYGHGPLSKMDGVWGLEGRKIEQASENGVPKKVALPTGKLFGAQLWLCTTCGYVELADGEN